MGVCFVVLTVSVVVAVVFMVRTMLQVRRTAAEAEQLLRGLNQELAAVQTITERASSFVKQLSSPFGLVGGLLTGALSAWITKRKKGQC
jgi:uncharacterized protein YoxC